MSELLAKITEDNLIIFCVLLCIAAFLITLIVSIELYNNKKKKKILLLENKNDEKELNIKKDDNIIYEVEDEELEKTKAKIELAKLKEKLEQEEKEKTILEEEAKKEEMVPEPVISQVENTTQVKVPEAQVVNQVKQEIPVQVAEEINKPESVIQTIVAKEEKLDNYLNKTIGKPVQPVQPVQEEKKEIKEETAVNNEQPKESVKSFEEEEEENAIISYDELKKAANFGYTDEEMDKYVDEKDAIISIAELERLYKESTALNIETANEKEEVELKSFDIKRVEDLPEISSEKKFQSTPFISPVYGIGAVEESLELEQTANLAKLNEEIKKTNEFLKALKELKKNLQ